MLSQNYFFFILFNLLTILVNFNYCLIIERDINLDGNNPFVKMKIGNQTEKKLLVSFLSPYIITFSNGNSQSSDPNDQITKFTYKSNVLNLIKRKVNLSLNGNESSNSLNIFEYSKSIDGMEKLEGILGLSRNGNNNLKNETFLEQLSNNSYISKTIIYIAPYYKDGKINNKSKIEIGEFPKEIKKEEMHAISLEGKDGFKCKISDVIIGDNHNKINANESFSAKFEEGQIEPISFPKKLFKTFTKFFNNCTINNNEFRIDCSNKTDFINYTNINFKICDKEFKVGSIWDGEKLKFKFTDDDSIILTSEFTGYYDRVYDAEENKIYLSNFGGYEAKKNGEGNKLPIIIILSVSALVLIGIIVVIIVVCVNKAKGNDLSKKVTSISFKDDQKEEDDDDESLLM